MGDSKPHYASVCKSKAAGNLLNFSTMILRSNVVFLTAGILGML
jgi:hypothetical protein